MKTDGKQTTSVRAENTTQESKRAFSALGGCSLSSTPDESMFLQTSARKKRNMKATQISNANSSMISKTYC